MGLDLAQHVCCGLPHAKRLQTLSQIRKQTQEGARAPCLMALMEAKAI